MKPKTIAEWLDAIDKELQGQRINSHKITAKRLKEFSDALDRVLSLAAEATLWAEMEEETDGK